jgi:hypothetical protein
MTTTASALLTTRLAPGKWLKRNLFSTWYNSLLTVVFGALIGWALIRFIGFLLDIDTRIIEVNLKLFVTGRFPTEDLSRLWFGALITTGGIGLFARAIVSNAEYKAIDAGMPFDRAGWRAVVRRFWPILMLIAVIAHGRRRHRSLVPRRSVTPHRRTSLLAHPHRGHDRLLPGDCRLRWSRLG